MQKYFKKLGLIALEEGKRIAEEYREREYDRTNYGIRDFLKPTLTEGALMAPEMFLSLPLLLVSPPIALMPQLFTYLGFRAYELFSDNDYIKGLMEEQKLFTFPNKKKREERTNPKSIDEVLS